MRKEIVLPGITVAAGVVGFLARRWELATAFEPDTGLVTPGMPATYTLLGLSAVVAVVLALLCRGRHNSLTGGYDQAFQARGNTVYITAVVLSAFLLLGAAVLIALGLPEDYRQAVLTLQASQARGNPLLTIMPKVLLSALCFISGLCVIATGKNNYRGEGRGKYSFTILMPAYTCCLWLIAAYQQRAADPVILDYLYELFAIITALLGLYFTAGFSFERAKVFRASFFSLLGVYFSMVTLADHHSLGTVLLYGFVIVYLLISTHVLLFNAAQPEGPRMCPPDRPARGQGEYETEETPDE